MITQKTKPSNIDEYMAGLPENIQKILEELRSTIRKAAPAAEETINYGIPTFTLNGNLVHFAAFKNHIGFYPAPSGIEAFKKELSVYDGAKGSVQFPIKDKLPLALITKIVKFRVKENIERAKEKTKSKKNI
jgi:uncharacterized protein YdhG (YjbR/CyaY superfamily)